MLSRFIENSILPNSTNVPARALKKFIAACNSNFGKQFSAELCKLGKECHCVWLLAGLVDKSGQNAEEICHELLTIRGQLTTSVFLRWIALTLVWLKRTYEKNPPSLIQSLSLSIVRFNGLGIGAGDPSCSLDSWGSDSERTVNDVRRDPRRHNAGL